MLEERELHSRFSESLIFKVLRGPRGQKSALKTETNLIASQSHLYSFESSSQQPQRSLNPPASIHPFHRHCCFLIDEFWTSHHNLSERNTQPSCLVKRIRNRVPNLNQYWRLVKQTREVARTRRLVGLDPSPFLHRCCLSMRRLQ